MFRRVIIHDSCLDLIMMYLVVGQQCFCDFFEGKSEQERRVCTHKKKRLTQNKVEKLIGLRELLV